MKRLTAIVFFLAAGITSLVAFAGDAGTLPGPLRRGDGPRREVLERQGNVFSVTPAMECGFMARSPVVTVTDRPRSQSRQLTWDLKFSASSRLFKDVSFANDLVGYITTELGGVFKTTDGGDNWQQKMYLGFPYYWYGVEAVSPDTVVIVGFDNQANINEGVIRWSLDGGDTWSQDIVLVNPNVIGWLDNVHFFDDNRGIVMARWSGSAFYTTNGGKDAASWTFVQIDPNSSWFSGNIDAQDSGDIYTTGINFAHSTDFGSSWTVAPSADPVFDGGVDFLDSNNLLGWTGGGMISPNVEGWVHRTTDGGGTWSPRLSTFPYPIRAIRFFSESLGIAVGGNVYSEAGGIYSTTDAGDTWTLDVDTNAEMFAIEAVRVGGYSYDVYCAGSTGGSTGFTGKLYKTRIDLIPDVNLNLDVLTPFVQYPGPLQVKLTVFNNEANSIDVDVFTRVQIPNGNWYPPGGNWLFGPYSVVIPPLDFREGILTHPIPAKAPVGSYLYEANVGELPAIWDTDADGFVVQ